MVRRPEATHGQMTKAYAAPERLLTTRKPKPKKEQDTYSYGVIVHGILSGELLAAQFSFKKGDRPGVEAIKTLKEDYA